MRAARCARRRHGHPPQNASDLQGVLRSVLHLSQVYCRFVCTVRYQYCPAVQLELHRTTTGPMDVNVQLLCILYSIVAAYKTSTATNSHPGRAARGVDLFE